MTSIHAPIPQNLQDAVSEAKRRGESDVSRLQAEPAERPATLRATSSTSSVVMKTAKDIQRDKIKVPSQPSVAEVQPENIEEQDDTKENDPDQSLFLATLSSESMGKIVLGKRPLSELPTPIDTEATDATASDLNILAGRKSPTEASTPVEPIRKSPKLHVSTAETNAHGRGREGDSGSIATDKPARSVVTTNEGKENIGEDLTTDSKTPSSQAASGPPRPKLRKVSNLGSSRSKAQVRTGIRRL